MAITSAIRWHREDKELESRSHIPNYREIRMLEEEIYGHPLTQLDGEPEKPTYQEEYYSTHEKRPMVDPPIYGKGTEQGCEHYEERHPYDDYEEGKQ